MSEEEHDMKRYTHKKKTDKQKEEEKKTRGEEEEEVVAFRFVESTPMGTLTTWERSREGVKRLLRKGEGEGK